MKTSSQGARRARAGAGGTQSIQRAVSLLRTVAHLNDHGVSASEVAAQTELDRTTVHRMLKCLAGEGLLKHAGDPRRYFLGPLTYQLGVTAAAKLDLRKICAPSMRRIAAETGDTVFLMAREGNASVCVDRQSGSYPVKTFVVDVGTRRPLGIGAGSLAILTALAPEEAAASLVFNASAVQTYPGITADMLREIARSARSTMRVNMGVVGVDGVHAVAVPIRDRTGNPVAAFSIAAIAPRMSASRKLELFDILERESDLVGGELDIL